MAHSQFAEHGRKRLYSSEAEAAQHKGKTKRKRVDKQLPLRRFYFLS